MRMTEQEAIKRIKEKHCTENQNCTDSCMHGVEHCAYSMAITALEKQIPKKPEICADVYNAQGELVGKDYRCSECGMGVAEGYICCPYCGQLLDWSEV